MERFLKVCAPDNFILKSEQYKSALKKQLLFTRTKKKVFKNRKKVKIKNTSNNKKYLNKFWRKLKFEDIWSSYNIKTKLAKSQFGKCGYCNSTLGENPEVDHFYPKGQLSMVTKNGESFHHLPYYRGRSMEQLSINGFWWLAYDWDNFVLTCNTCNGKFKRDIFPIKEEINKKFLEIGDYTPALLSPYFGPLPYKYFSYKERGQVKILNGKGTLAKNSIETYGLKRKQLSRDRMSTCKYSIQILKDFEKAKRNNTHYTHILYEIIELGHPYSTFPSIIKSLLLEMYDVYWEELEGKYQTEFNYVNGRTNIILEAEYLAIELIESGNSLEVQTKVIGFYDNHQEFSNEIEVAMKAEMEDSRINLPI